MSSTAIAASAARWLARGQSCEAVARELAWSALRGVRGDHAELDWLVPLVEAELAARVQELAVVAQQASIAARADHLRLRPHDHDGADTVAELEAHDAAVAFLSRTYLDVLDWAVGLLRARMTPTRRRRLRRREPLHAQPVECDVPKPIAERAARDEAALGWPRRRAA